MFLVWPFTSERAASELAPTVVEAITQRVQRVVYLSADVTPYRPVLVAPRAANRRLSRRVHVPASHGVRQEHVDVGFPDPWR
jgi:hypothetical protein